MRFHERLDDVTENRLGPCHAFEWRFHGCEECQSCFVTIEIMTSTYPFLILSGTRNVTATGNIRGCGSA